MSDELSAGELGRAHRGIVSPQVTRRDDQAAGRRRAGSFIHTLANRAQHEVFRAADAVETNIADGFNIDTRPARA